MNDRTNEGDGHEYDGQELELLMDAAATVLMATVAADPTGPIGYFAEMTAAGTFLYEARDRYRDNRLVQELYARQQEDEAGPRGGNTGPGTDGAGAASDQAANRAEIGVTKETLLNDISRVDRILRRDPEGMEFRRFLYDLAQEVARASRSSWFGPRISSEEESFLAQLRSVLGLPLS